MIKKLLSRIDIKTTNDKLLLALSFLLFLPLLLDFISAITHGGSGKYSFAIYAVSFFVIIIRFSRLIKAKSIFAVIGVWLIYLINAFLFPASQEYIFDSQMLILYCYFIPISFLFITQIKDWSSFFRILSYFGLVSIFMAARVILYVISIPDLLEEGVFSYMEFSYALSPLLCAMFARFMESNKYIYLIAFVIGILEMFAYSSRAALFFTLIFVVIAAIYYIKRSRKKTLVFVGTLCTVAVFSTSMLDKMENSEFFGASYVLKRFLSGEVSDSQGRDYIYQQCRRRIHEVGADFNGLFGDRPYCGDVYPHNLIYEVYMQMGYLIGTIMLMIFLFFILRTYFKSPYKLVVVFFLLTILAKFFVSDSYLISGKFWILLGILVSLNNYPIRNRNEHSCDKCNIS